MKAYITLLSTKEYLNGVLALHQSLLNVGAKYPLVVGITPNIDPTIRDVLFQKKIEVIELQGFSYPKECKRLFSLTGAAHWFYTSAKINIFGLEEFEKLVYIDSDMLVIRNIDELFERPHGTASQDGPEVLEEPEKHQSLNSGLIVIEPSKDIEEKLKDICIKHKVQDQDALTILYPDWKDKKELHLPPTYNLFFPFLNQYYLRGVDISNVKVFHFVGKEKPFLKEDKKPIRNVSNFFENYYLNCLFEAQKDIIF